MLKCASIIFEVLSEKRVGEAEFRNVDLDIVASNLRACKTSAYVFSTGFLVMKFFFSNTQFMIGISGM